MCSFFFHFLFLSFFSFFSFPHGTSHHSIHNHKNHKKNHNHMNYLQISHKLITNFTRIHEPQSKILQEPQKIHKHMVLPTSGLYII